MRAHCLTADSELGVIELDGGDALHHVLERAKSV